MPVELQLAYHAGCDQCERVKNMHQLVQSPNTQFDLHKLRTGLEELSFIPRLPFLGIITSCRHHSLHKGSNAEIIVILTVWKLKEPTLVTIGDAVASFLYDPDPTTAGICLSSKSSIQSNKWKLQPAKPWNPKRHFWFRAASIKRWLTCNILCVFPLSPLHSLHSNPSNNLVV